MAPFANHVSIDLLVHQAHVYKSSVWWEWPSLVLAKIAIKLPNSRAHSRVYISKNTLIQKKIKHRNLKLGLGLLVRFLRIDRIGYFADCSVIANLVASGRNRFGASRSARVSSSSLATNSTRRNRNCKNVRLQLTRDRSRFYPRAGNVSTQRCKALRAFRIKSLGDKATYLPHRTH